MSGPLPAAVAAAAAQHAAQAKPKDHLTESRRRQFQHTRAALLARMKAGTAEQGAAAVWARMSLKVRILLALTVLDATRPNAEAVAMARWAELPEKVRANLGAHARELHRETAGAHLLLL